MAEPAIEDQVKQLRHDIATLRGDVGGLARLLGEEGMRRMQEARHAATDLLRARRDDLVDATHEHPVGSLALAFAAGFVVAKLLELGARR